MRRHTRRAAVSGLQQPPVRLQHNRAGRALLPQMPMPEVGMLLTVPALLVLISALWIITYTALKTFL